MKRLINYLRGTVRVVVTGPFPERVINLCAQARVDFWAVDWLDEHTIAFTIRHCGMTDALHLAQKADCTLIEEERRGLPVFAAKFRRRYGFLIGLSLALCAVSILSGIILSVEVTGHEQISEAVILQHLQRHGVRPGAYGPALDRRQIEQEILMSLEDLAWMTINLHGTRVDVQVKEKQPVPDRVDEKGFFHVVAKADGIIERIEPEFGDALTKVGDTVGKGDILISGTVTLEPPQYSDLPERYYFLHARGRVWARTWRYLTAAVPCTVMTKCYTGESKTVLAINFFGNRVEIFGNSSILDGPYDKITSVRRVGLPMGIQLPVWILQEEYHRYETQYAEVDIKAASRLLEERLKESVEDLVGKDGQVLRTDFETRVSDGLICVTVSAECTEEIGQEVPAQRES